MNEEEALKFVLGRVGKNKIPKYVKFVEDLPKAASGKVQKFLLKEWHHKKLQIGKIPAFAVAAPAYAKPALRWA